jgi:hypothetical protein
MMLKRIESADGQSCVEILRREDGSFQFREGKWYPPFKDGEWEVPEGYWGYLFSSGVYGTAEDAEREAIAFLGAERGSIFRADDC